MKRNSATAIEHQVVLSLSDEQRTNFNDLTCVKEDSEDFFRNQKFKTVINPYQEIFLYNKTLIVAHGNMMSYYNLKTNSWVKHYKFSEGADQSEVNGLNQTLAYALRKKVLRMFRYDSNVSQFSIGILFQDGTFKKILFETDSNGSDSFSEHEVQGKIEGQIISVASDREHHRILYAISVLDGVAKLWGFTKGNLHELPAAKVTPNSKIIPFFSPADNTQVIIVTPEHQTLRIYEHEASITEDGAPDLTMKRVKKIFDEGMEDRIDLQSLHSIVATPNIELVMLFDNKNMYVYDMRTAEF